MSNLHEVQTVDMLPPEMNCQFQQVKLSSDAVILIFLHTHTHTSAELFLASFVLILFPLCNKKSQMSLLFYSGLFIAVTLFQNNKRKLMLCYKNYIMVFMHVKLCSLVGSCSSLLPFYQTTQLHIPENHNLSIHHHENLKSHISLNWLYLRVVMSF
jgi:hypothetical protein